eukprot:RCo010255
MTGSGLVPGGVVVEMLLLARCCAEVLHELEAGLLPPSLLSLPAMLQHVQLYSAAVERWVTMCFCTLPRASAALQNFHQENPALHDKLTAALPEMLCTELPLAIHRWLLTCLGLLGPTLPTGGLVLELCFQVVIVYNGSLCRLLSLSGALYGGRAGAPEMLSVAE